MEYILLNILEFWKAKHILLITNKIWTYFLNTNIINTAVQRRILRSHIPHFPPSYFFPSMFVWIHVPQSDSYGSFLHDTDDLFTWPKSNQIVAFWCKMLVSQMWTVGTGEWTLFVLTNNVYTLQKRKENSVFHNMGPLMFRSKSISYGLGTCDMLVDVLD